MIGTAKFYAHDRRTLDTYLILESI